MSKPDHSDEIAALKAEVERIEDSFMASEEACAGYRAACHQAEQNERLIREELDDVQRENMRLKGWQDCAREILGSSVRSTLEHNHNHKI